MVVWRICKERHVATALSGIGAEKAGGRWNYPGERVVYLSSSLSLAALELFVHLEPNSAPDDLFSIAVTIPDSATSERLAIDDLPKDWRMYPAPSTLQDIGSQWLREQGSLLLLVPSAVNPEEQNILLNPLHREASTISNVVSKPFQHDPRMWKHGSHGKS
jgi:RES domain-containing protein